MAALLVSTLAAICFWGAAEGANRSFANNCQQSGLGLDYIQFKYSVQFEGLAVTLIRQQDRPNLDSGWARLVEQML